MKIKISVDRQAAILAGHEWCGPQIIDMPVAELSPEQRQTLLGLRVSDGIVEADSLYEGYPVLASADVSGALRVLDGYAAQAVADAAAVAARQAESARTLERMRARALAAPVQDLDVGLWRYHHSSDGALHYDDVPAVASVVDWVGRRAEFAIYREGLAAREAEIALGAGLRRAQAEERLRAWAELSGSGRLRMMFALGAGDWVSVARREYQDAYAPAGYVRGSAGGSPCKRPALHELQELERMRQLVAAAPERYSDATLDYVGSGSEEEGDFVAPAVVVEIRVCSPDGDCTWYHRVPPRADSPSVEAGE